jgi:hypothetical protein
LRRSFLHSPADFTELSEFKDVDESSILPIVTEKTILNS